LSSGRSNCTADVQQVNDLSTQILSLLYFWSELELFLAFFLVMTCLFLL